MEKKSLGLVNMNINITSLYIYDVQFKCYECGVEETIRVDSTNPDNCGVPKDKNDFNKRLGVKKTFTN